MPPVKKSSVWKAFVKTSYGGKCKLCNSEVKTSGNTTNLNKHLTRRHPNLIEKSATNVTGAKGSASSSAAAVSVDKPPDTSDVDEDDLSMPPSSPSSSIATFSYQPLISQSFSNIRLFSGGLKGNKITEGIIYMIAKDNLPLVTTEKEGFKHFMNILAPLYKVPGRKSITRLIDEKYDVFSLIVKKQLEKIQHVTLTTDIWTDRLNTRSVLGLTCHFYFENQLHSITVGVTDLEERHTAEYISNVIRNLCTEWNISVNNVTAVITDNGKNIVKSVNDVFGKNIHLPCFAHTLDLVASKIINDTEQIKAVIDKIKRIVAYFIHSVVAADELRKAQEGGDILKLIQSVPTRWNSTYFKIERFLKLSGYVAPILLKNPQSPAMIDSSEMVVVKEVTSVLAPVEVVSREICAERYLTASEIIPIINCLVENLKNTTPTTEQGKKFKLTTVNELQKRFGAVEQVNALAVCTILDPRFKKIHFNNKAACAQAINNINAFCGELTSEHAPTVDENVCETDEEISIWSFHNKLANKSVEEQADKGDLYLYLKIYLNSPVLPIGADAIAFWKNISSDDALKQIAVKYLSIVRISVPSETFFESWAHYD